VGPESNSGHMVAYLDGKHIEIKGPLPEFTIEDISEDARTAKKALEAWEDICITMEVVGDGLRDFLDKTELRIAVCLAGCYKSTKAMAHRYLHTKKKRTRKKYEKRIRAWFREVFR